jgi:UDP:flavonoid glycosyltransferase YjiC (YdhE family)
MRNAKGRSDVIKVLMFMESFWTETHGNLDQVVLNRRPDLIFGDVLDLQACTDIAKKHSIPLATMHPQVPFNLPAPGYMPGIPGFQQRCLTSEHASIWDRLCEQIFAVKLIFSLRHFILWRTKMRRDADMPRAGLVRQPRHLYLINAFFGLDVPRELPPLVVPVGPLMYHDFPPLDRATEQFLQAHPRTIYIAFGTHVTMGGERFLKILNGVRDALSAGFLDGVLWAIKRGKDFDLSNYGPDMAAMLENRKSNWRFLSWAPQRAILDHPSIVAFISHCGSNSTYESCFHGVPVIAMPIFNDQFKHAKCLSDAGIGLSIDKLRFTESELCEKTGIIVNDSEGSFKRNSLRIKRIASLQSKKKEYAADLIEELIYDHELRFNWNEHDIEWDIDEGDARSSNLRGKVRCALRPPHLQTADARMPWYKARNYDLWLCYALALLTPVIIASSACKLFWR